jgi:predicted transposase YbfD/YdcC
LCQEIIDSGGAYLFAVKDNQPGLLRDIELEFAAQPAAFSPSSQHERLSERQRCSEPDKGHGRQERRTLISTVTLNHHLDWPSVKQVCRIERERTKGEKSTTETAYYITSLPRHEATAAQLETIIRDDWGRIENGVHWVRDMVLDEDRCTIYRGHSPQNWATARNAALNFLRSLKSDNLAATIRNFTRNSLRLFAILGYVK